MTDIIKPLTPKQEAFAQKYVETGHASNSYRSAYDAENTATKAIHTRASELLANSNVAVRIKELQANVMVKHEVTMESLAKEYEDHRLAAFDDKQFGVCNSSTTGKAKLYGLNNDKPVADMQVIVNLVSFNDD